MVAVAAPKSTESAIEEGLPKDDKKDALINKNKSSKGNNKMYPCYMVYYSSLSEICILSCDFIAAQPAVYQPQKQDEKQAAVKPGQPSGSRKQQAAVKPKAALSTPSGSTMEDAGAESKKDSSKGKSKYANV